MLQVVTLMCVAMLATALPAGKILEHDLTVILQEAFAPYDPATIDAITDLNIVTDHSSLMFNAKNVLTTGFAKLEVTNFIPPIPFVSHSVTMALTISNLKFHTEDYSLSGTHDSKPYSAAGAGDLTMHTFGVEVKFKAESYSFDPMSVCVELGTLTADLSVDTIDSELAGADEVNADINANGPAFLEGVEQELNANADNIVNMINNALCVARRH